MAVLVPVIFACDHPACDANETLALSIDRFTAEKLDPPRGWAIGPIPNTVGYGEEPTQGCACPKHNNWLRTGEVK